MIRFYYDFAQRHPNEFDLHLDVPAGAASLALLSESQSFILDPEEFQVNSRWLSMRFFL